MRQFELHSCENEGHAISSHNSDFSDRDKAVHLLQGFFGEENVIPVSNFAALKPLSLIKDLCKLYNVPFEVVNKYTTTMIPEVMAVKKAEPGFDAAQYELTFEDLAEHSVSFQEFTKNVSSQFPGFQNTLDVLWKQQRNVGRHAGGVIITNNTRDTMPLIKAKGGLQTPWPEGIAARHLEDFGLLKFDVLGLGTLRMFEETIRRILQKKGKKYVSQADINQWFFENLHPDNNSLDDLRVYKHVYWEGRYAGVFQFVKDNVQRFMKEMRPTSVLDIAIATSIYRPGPMGLGAHNIFLENRKNPSKVRYVHPVLKEVLGFTGGLLIFQEQLQLIVNRLSGMHLDDTDGIRKAFTKKDKSNADKQAKEIKALGEKFVQDSMAYSGISESDAQEVWKDFEKWTAYGFNKSHAMAYAITSYQCVHGQTRIFDWETRKYTTVAKAYREGGVNKIACYDEKTGKTIGGQVKKIIRTTGAKNVNLKMAYVLHTSSGKKLVCSKDHPILTDANGYQTLENLKVGDKIACEKNVLSRYGTTLDENRKTAIAVGVKRSWAEMAETTRQSRFDTLARAGDKGRAAASLGAKKWWKTLSKPEKKARILSMQDAARGTNGWSTRYIGHANCGHRVSSSNELALCNWLHAHGLPHEVQVARDTFGFCDVRCKGIWIEFDGIGRSDDYFERKYGDEPFIKLTSKTQIESELNFLLQDEPIMNGDEIVYEEVVSIAPWKETVMYDIVMESEPHNFLANNIVVHNCAWFLTYYPDEWIASYLDFATVGKGKSASGEDPKSVALMEARSLGYKVGKPDINLSEENFTMKPGRVLIPSFSAIKGVGKAALYEIKTHRPYTQLRDLIVNPDGSWRHSKFNKRAFGNLIKTGAFESMDLVGPGKTFANYKQMYTALIDNYDKLKKTAARKKNNNAAAELDTIIQDVIANQPGDWTADEKIAHSKELTGQIDMSLVVTPKMVDYFTRNKVESIDSFAEEGDFYWGIVDNCTVDTSSTGKQFLRLTFHGESGAKRSCKVWSFNEDTDLVYEKNDIIVGKFKKDQWGLKTFPSSIQVMEVKTEK